MPVTYRATNILTSEVIEDIAESVAEKIGGSAQNIYGNSIGKNLFLGKWKIVKAGKVPYKKICVTCGKVFETDSKQALCCSPHCSYKRRYQNEDVLKDVKKPSKKLQTLEDEAVHAMQADQTYGKYKAQLYLEEEKRKRVEDLKVLYNLNRGFKYHVDKTMRSKGMDLEKVLGLPSINRIAKMYEKGGR